MRRPSEALLGQWIKTAWDDISPESIVKGFRRCCVSNDMNGTEDDVLWEEDHEEKTLVLVMKVLKVLTQWCVCNFLLQ
jgi:hypothetical protein